MNLVERESELGRITARLPAGPGSPGSVVVLDGDPGIGKTAFVAALHSAAESRGAARLTAQGGELERELPFAIVRQLFGPCLVDADARAGLLEGSAALAAPLFGYAGPESDMGAVVHGLYWLCANLSERGPLLVTVDDAHWCDEASLRFLSTLARRITDLPVLLVLATRPAPPGQTAPLDRALAGAGTETARLRPLTPSGVAGLVRAALAPDAEEAFCHAVARATGGNPFLLTEALLALRADGVAPVAAQAHRVDAIRPRSVSRGVLTRLGRHGEDAIRLAHAVAVLGPAADLRRAALLAGIEPPSAAAALAALAYEALTTGLEPIEFAHPLVRAAVYADMPEGERALAHERAAHLLADEGIPSEQLVPHLLGAALDGDSWVAGMLRAAASDALAHGAPESAASCLERALAGTRSRDARRALLVELGRVYGMLNRSSRAIDVLREALDLTPDRDERLSIQLALTRALALTGQGPHARRLLAALGGFGPDDGPAASLRTLAGIVHARQHAEEAPQRWLPDLDAAAHRITGRTADEMTLLGLLANGAASSADRPSGEVAAIALRAAVGPGPRDFWVYNLVGSALAIAGRLDEATDLLGVGIRAAQEAGDVSAFGWLAVVRSHTAFYAGRLMDAEADARAALDLYVADDSGIAAAVLAETLIERGDIDAAQQVLDDHGLADVQPVSNLTGHFIRMPRGNLRLAQNRPKEALADLLACGESLTSIGYSNPAYASWRADAVRALLALGDREEARALAADNLARARAFEEPRTISMALRALARVEGHRAGIPLLREAVALGENAPARLEHARALVDLGAALRRAGHRAEARQPLRLGLDAAHRCGARAVADFAQDELVAAGGRPRRAALVGPDALTAGERRVVDLVRQGRTNRQIAQALMVRPRTVETHLSSTFRKLGITSREQLRQPPSP